MSWTRSAYPCLKPQGQQLTKNGKKENYKHLSLLFSGYKHYQMKGKVRSLKCILFMVEEYVFSIITFPTSPFTISEPQNP